MLFLTIFNEMHAVGIESLVTREYNLLYDGGAYRIFYGLGIMNWYPLRWKFVNISC